MIKNGALVISLDFELLWGVFDHFDINNSKYFMNTLDVIPRCLDIFEKNNIHVTWATVGMLFNQNKEEWITNKPDQLPNYKNHKLNSYCYGDKYITNKNEHLFFAPKIIKQIQSVPCQEIGTHTYSHYYCLEEGQTHQTFEEDLLAAIKVANGYNIKLDSLIFPRNQYNSKYLNLCNKYGIRNVRSNPNDWYWDTLGKETLHKKVFRSLDAYINLGDKTYDYSIINSVNNVNSQPASRFLRPLLANTLMNKLLLSRVQNEMTYAARNNRIYHLWWHPHNFGNHPSESIDMLEKIILQFNKLRDQSGFISLNMSEL